MSTKLYELNDRIVTDKGEVVAKYELLVKKALSGEVFTELPAVTHPDIARYNQRCPDNAIRTWTDTGIDTLEGPDPETHEWTIPEEYQNLDIIQLATECLVSKGLENDQYIDRLGWELEQMSNRGMFPFIRCLLYVTDQFHEHGVVWGVGRGSSCASLVLYVLGINRVDPCRYNIPAEEFFK